MLKPITTNTKSYRPDIDGLRAIAVLLVLFYHVFPNSITGGFIGVDIFFVISGYLISGIILNALNENRFSFKDFFFRRIKRIYPVLMLVLFTSYFLGWFFLMPKEFKELNKHILGGVGFVANFTLWQDSGYFDSLPELKPLMHLWSLGIEEQFYLVWPLSLFILWKFHSKYIFFFVFAIILSFITNIFFIKNYPEAVFYFPFTRFWELMMGSLLALLALKKRIQLSKRVENVLSFLGFLFILIATIKLSKHSSFPGWWAILPTIGSVFIIQSQNSWLNKKILSNKIAVWIGLISYPLYLWHWLIISFTYFVIGDLPYKLDRIGIIVVSFLVAWFSFRYVESPIRHAKKSGKIVLNLISVSFIIGILSFSSFKLNGIPERMENKISNMPSELRELLNPDFGGIYRKELERA
jgi:peptidoglycan/LPS O-acetylase OafA/YrhL